MAKRKAAKTNGDAAPRRGRPRQEDLPGTEDRAIKPLEQAAAEYADIRDQRMELNESEAQLKANLLKLMKKHGKTVYHRDGITITVVSEEESVKVRVKKAGENDETPANGREFDNERAAAVAED